MLAVNFWNDVLDLLVLKADQFSNLHTGTGFIHVGCKCRFYQDVCMCSLEYANDYCLVVCTDAVAELRMYCVLQYLCNVT